MLQYQYNVHVPLDTSDVWHIYLLLYAILYAVVFGWYNQLRCITENFALMLGKLQRTFPPRVRKFGVSQHHNHQIS